MPTIRSIFLRSKGVDYNYIESGKAHNGENFEDISRNNAYDTQYFLRSKGVDYNYIESGKAHNGENFEDISSAKIKAGLDNNLKSIITVWNGPSISDGIHMVFVEKKNNDNNLWETQGKNEKEYTIFYIMVEQLLVNRNGRGSLIAGYTLWLR